MLSEVKYRSRADIASEVLQSMSNGNVNLMRIMYGSFTSYVQAREYVTFLQKKGLIRFDGPSRTYGMTEEGVKFLGKLRDIGTVLSIEHAPATSPDITRSHILAEAVVGTRRVADRVKLDSRPIIMRSNPALVRPRTLSRAPG
jgi:predicted transcriptional regulator